MFRGIEQKHEHSAQSVVRDTRPLGKRISDFFANPIYVAAILAAGAVLSLVLSAIADLFLLLGLLVYLFFATRKITLPFRMPKSANAYDYNDCIPGTSKPKKSGGICYFGNDRVTGKELWFTNDDMRTHALIFGSTGSGKTEALVSIAYNALVHGSGFIYIDGKGDNSLFSKVFSMTRAMGREDDMLLINFMTGARDIIGPQKTRLSNTMNPFAIGSSSMLSQLVVSLMDSSGGQGGGSGDSDMWKNRAISFVEALMKVLVAMRDAGHILLDAHSIRRYFVLEKLEQISVDKQFPISDEKAVPIHNLPSNILDPIDNYLENLPGYVKSQKYKQSGEVREQHGFITMQLTRTFSSLADTYGHIVRTKLAEVDFKDVVLNRRIMVVLLPALEKSPDELANLGKIIVASLKAMMAAGLGDEVEGEYRDVIQRKPTNSPTPYMCIMDEYGYYAVQGFAVVPAQARSLGFSAIFAGQDLPAFQKASKEEAASIGANTNIKICMKLEDPTETWEFFNKTAGESYVTNVQNFQINPGSMINNYLDSKSTSVDRRQRIELLDLKDQREGEAHIFFKSNIIRATMFYANPKPVKKMRLNIFVKVDKPDSKICIELDKRLVRFNQVFGHDAFQFEADYLGEDIALMEQALSTYAELPAIERTVAATIALLEHHVAKSYDDDAEEIHDEMSAFTKVAIPPVAEKLLNEDDYERFEKPLINRGSLEDSVKFLERLAGRTESEAAAKADSLMHDIFKSTVYPPDVTYTPKVNEVVQAIQDYADFLLGKRRGTSEVDDDDDLDDL